MVFTINLHEDSKFLFVRNYTFIDTIQLNTDNTLDSDNTLVTEQILTST